MSDEPDTTVYAFPVPIQNRGRGMTLRDWMAGQALAGFMQHNGWIGYTGEPQHREFLLSQFADDAYAVADAMLAERQKP
jgi:hypothetical protein